MRILHETSHSFKRVPPMADLDSLRRDLCSRCHGAGQIPVREVHDEDGHCDLESCDAGCNGGPDYHAHTFEPCFRCRGLGIPVGA
jgi:hypothetical protein